MTPSVLAPPPVLVVHDAYHGDITLTGDAVAVYQSFPVQRLSRISQCGVVAAVFPAMTHSRLAHSLGAAHLAAQLVDALAARHPERALEFSDEFRQDVVVAALCHDLGHGPFSHLWDELFATTLTHEARSALLFAWVARQHLPHWPPERVERVRELIFPQRYPHGLQYPWQYEIVANPRTGLDVDKFDYLTRDLHLARVLLPFDARELLENAALAPEGVLYPDALVRQVFGARAALHSQVYRHPRSLGLQLVLTDLLNERAAEYVQCTNSEEAVCSDAFLRLDDQSSVARAAEGENLHAFLARQGYHFWGRVHSAVLEHHPELPADEGRGVHLVSYNTSVLFYSRLPPTATQLAIFKHLRPELV